MKSYELLYIVPTQYADTEIGNVMTTMKAMVEKEGAVLKRQENLGRIKLAYPVKGIRHGSYILMQFEAETEVMNEIDRRVRLAEEVLRHQITLMPKGAEKKTYEISSYVAPLSEEAEAAQASYQPKAKEIVPATPVAVEPEKPAMSMEELDKKLDEILESEITDV
jgi:small subunit ribosomal protein S6